MVIEVLTDENGTILAMNAAHDGREPRRLRTGEAHDDASESASPRPPKIAMRPRVGQERHLVTLPDEFEQMPLKEIHRSFRLVHDAAGPRLERVEP
jgi:hypothetical protein